LAHVSNILSRLAGPEVHRSLGAIIMKHNRKGTGMRKTEAQKIASIDPLVALTTARMALEYIRFIRPAQPEKRNMSRPAPRSAFTIMAHALAQQLGARQVKVSPAECEQILICVVDRTAAAASATLASQGLEPH
jgi:hypothetical protein